MNKNNNIPSRNFRQTLPAQCIKDEEMKIRGLIILLILLPFTMSFAQEKRPKVLLETDSGNITIELYNETPLHRDNFLKLAREGFYNGTSFHRVIEAFMIQGGDPNSKNEGATNLGSGGPGYTVAAEINPLFFHKKGALCAARQGDNVNPERRSSGSQFYIVQGKVYNDSLLTNFEAQINYSIKQQVARAFYLAPENKEYLTRLQTAQKTQDQQALQQISDETTPIIEAHFKEKEFHYSPEQKKAYSTIGGTPHLDMQYTVFGEVVDGLEVVDKIASVPKNGEKPIKPLRMKVTVVE